MEPIGLEQLKRQRFSEVRRRAVNVMEGELVKSRLLNPEHNLPLVIEPAINNLELSAWARTNRVLIEAKLLKHGALLFRNFKMRSLADFRSLIDNVFPHLEVYEIRICVPETDGHGDSYCRNGFT